MKLEETYIVKRGTKIWSQARKSFTLEADIEVVLKQLRGYDAWCENPEFGLINVHTSFLKKKTC